MTPTDETNPHQIVSENTTSRILHLRSFHLRCFSFWVLCLLLAFSLALTAGCKKGPAKKNDKEAAAKTEKDKTATDDKDAKKKSEKKSAEFLTPVIVHKLSRDELRVTVSTTANVVPLRTASLETLESGIVRFTKLWEEGDRITTNTIIARLVNDELTKQKENAEADLQLQRQSVQAARTRMRQAERNFGIIQDLYARGLSPLRDVEQAKLERDTTQNSFRQAEINLEKAQLALRSIEERFSFLEVSAPFVGILVGRARLEGRSGMAKTFGSEPLRVLEGRFLPKNTILCGLMDTSRVLLMCDVTSKDIAKVRVGQDALATVYGRENIEVAGRVISVANHINAETRAFDVAVEVDNPEGRLLSGMFGRVEIIVRRVPDVIAISKTIVQRRGEKDMVFVTARPDDLDHAIAEERIIELGTESKELVEVRYGLQKDEELVVRGYEILQDKLPIQVAYDDEPTT